MVCPSCQGDEVIEDYSQTLAQFVCVKCGTVVDVENEFKSPDNGNCESKVAPYSRACGSSNWRHSLRRHSSTKKEHSSTYQRAVAVVSELAMCCGVPTFMKNEAAQLFEDACKCQQLKCFHALKKSMLAASCFYVTVRKHGWPVSISYIATFLCVPSSQINDAFKHLVKEFSIEITAPDLEELVHSFLQQLKVEDLSGAELISRMKIILQLSKLSLLSTGVAAQQLLIAVCYVSWCSVHVRKQKPTSFPKFCQKYGLPNLMGSSARKRVAELIQMLIDLAKNIPSLAGANIDKNSIFWHVETILKFPRFSMQRKSDALEEESNKTYTFLRQSVKRKRNSSDESNDSSKASKLISENHDLNAPELSELDIPESEMHKYVRNDKEINLLKNLHQTT